MSTRGDRPHVLTLSEDGPPLDDGPETRDVIGDAFGQEAEVVVVPVRRLDPEFFRLRTGVAGSVVQKFVNYRLRLVVLGDTGSVTDPSGPVADWVREANRGRELWFVADEAELAQRLAPRA